MLLLLQVRELESDAQYVIIIAGQGAWQEWSYEIEFLDTAFMDSVLVESIQGVTSTLVNLTAETQYIIRVGAYSTAGRGPWSNRFVGRTLKSG